MQFWKGLLDSIGNFLFDNTANLPSLAKIYLLQRCSSLFDTSNKSKNVFLKNCSFVQGDKYAQPIKTVLEGLNDLFHAFYCQTLKIRWWVISIQINEWLRRYIKLGNFFENGWIFVLWEINFAKPWIFKIWAYFIFYNLLILSSLLCQM